MLTAGGKPRHLPTSNEETDMTIMFHGGCSGCTMQDLDGIDECRKCKCFDADWSLPNLNNRPDGDAEKERKRIIKKYGLAA